MSGPMTVCACSSTSPMSSSSLPTRPPRATAQVLADAIDQVLISHFDTHRAEIEAKLRG